MSGRALGKAPVRGVLAILVYDSRDSYEQVRVERGADEEPHAFAERVQQETLKLQMKHRAREGR